MTNAANESWHHQLSNPGALTPITSPTTARKPLHQEVVLEMPNILLLYFTMVFDACMH